MAQKVVPYYALVTLVVHNGVTEARGCPLPGGQALSPRSRRQGPASALSTLCSGAVRIPRAPPPGPPPMRFSAHQPLATLPGPAAPPPLPPAPLFSTAFPWASPLPLNQELKSSHFYTRWGLTGHATL